MKTKEEKQKKFLTEFEINGRKYAGEIWATSWNEAEDFVKQRATTEEVVGLFQMISIVYISHPFLLAFSLQ